MPDASPNVPHSDAVERYRQILDSAKHFGIISMDLERKVASWNAGAQHILGWTEQEMLGQPADCIFTPEDRTAGIPSGETRQAETQGWASDERWHLRKNGERFWAVGELTPLTDGGRITGYVKILRDRTEQKNTEAKLLELNDRLESLVAERTRERDRLWRNSLDLLLVIDPAGMLRALNPAWTRVLGYAPEELLNHHFEPFVHPDDVTATLDAIARATRAPVVKFEVRVRHKDGHYLWFDWSAAAEDNAIYANGRDITLEKQQAEQLMATSRTRLKLALEAGAMGVWEWDMQSGEVTLLQGTDRLHGRLADAGNIVFHSMADYMELIHPDDRAEFARIAALAQSGAGDQRVEYRVVWPDGSVRWMEARGMVYADASGKPVRMVGVSVDINQRKKHELELKFLAQASAELADLVDPQSTLDKLASLAVPSFADWCAMDLLQEDGSLIRVAVAHTDPAKVELAHEMHRRFPPSRERAEGPWSIILSSQPQLAPEVSSDMLAGAIADPEHLAYMMHLGVRSYIGVPLQAHGKILGSAMFVTAESKRVYDSQDLEMAADLAQRAAVAIENANLYRTLQASDRGKDVFLATLSHELRNPLAAVMNGLSILKLGAAERERVERTAQVMERQVRQLSRMVDDLMDLSRITTGKIELQKETVSLASILSNAVETSRPLIEAGRHQLVVSLPPQSSTVLADPVRLTQVFGNLLNNAAKYTNPGGRIELTLDAEPEQYVVHVKDNGVGIAPDMLTSVFAMFIQGGHPLERSHGGLGIGLSLVDGLVKMHGGKVQAISAGPNCGTDMVVRLPRPAAPVQEAPQDSARPQGSTPGRHILVVDDNIDAAETIAELLGMLGNRVDLAHDGLAAVAEALRLRPQIVLLDIGLPGIDGYEAARRIRKELADHKMTLIALTGWGQEQDRKRAFDAGFDRHVVKPVTLAQLEAVLG